MKKLLSWFREKPYRYFLVTFLVIFIDQAVKVSVKLTMGRTYFHEMDCGQKGTPEVKVVGDLFKITFAENNGAAFSMSFADLIPFLSPSSAKTVLSLFSFCAIFLIIYFFRRVRNFPNALPLVVALILGGALGNIIDRVFYGVIFHDINCSWGQWGDPDYYPGSLLHGRVVDMFFLDIWRGYLPNWLPIWGGDYMSFWPIFNVADSAISVGIVSVILFQGRFFGASRKKEEESPAPKEEATVPGAEEGAGGA